MKKPRLVIGIIISIALLIGLGFLIDGARKSATISILIVPQSAEIRLNGDIYKNGDYNVAPGEYKITATKENFETYEESFTVAKGETKKIYLIMTELEGDWFKDHPEDVVLMDPIKSYQLDQNAANLKTSYPLIADLPISIDYYRSYNSERIKYDISYRLEDGNPIIVIIDYTGNNYNRALKKIESLGYNPSDYKIEYQDRVDK